MNAKDYIQENYKLFIGGEWVDAEDGKTFTSYNPSNGEELATIASASAADVDKAVKAGQKAFESWKDSSPAERAALLNKIAETIENNLEHLAMVETLDNGKAIRETVNSDIPTAADHFRYFAGVIRAEEGKATMLDKDTMSIILREPLGVVGQIVPWNFPFLMAAWKIAPAIATGNAIVFKPASPTALSVLELMRLIQDFLPKGLINVVPGGGSTCGQAILDHPDIKKLAFTGSTEVGYNVADAAAKKLVPATLELGGKSANIFFPDIDWDKALEGAALGCLWNAGQVCCAGSRILVHEDIYDEFVERLKVVFENVKVGLPWEKDTMMGANINEGQLQSILNYVEIGKKEGARLVTGGYRVTENGLDKGCFLAPTMFADVDNSMRIAQEEIFGPVVVVIKFKDEADAIRIANDSEYGLGGAVWSHDINRAIRVSRAIETGRMWVNTYGSTPAHIPFGGYKKSGLGRETHLMMMDHYSNVKSIMISLTEEKSGLY